MTLKRCLQAILHHTNWLGLTPINWKHSLDNQDAIKTYAPEAVASWPPTIAARLPHQMAAALSRACDFCGFFSPWEAFFEAWGMGK